MIKSLLVISLLLLVTSSVCALESVKIVDAIDGKLTIDQVKGEVTYQDITTPMVVDDLFSPDVSIPFSDTPVIVKDKADLDRKINQVLSEDFSNVVITKGFDKDTKGFVHLPYYNPDNVSEVYLDIYIEETFYYTNQAALDDFWDKFFPRFQKLKELTSWSSLRLFGVPLEMYNYGHSAACYGGNASPTHSNVVFSDPMYKAGCNKPYYENGSPHYNNPGDLGDWWPYMDTALHEATHSIMPYPIYTRSWLTEGWAEYYMYNTLTYTVESNLIPDINQETADTYLYNGFPGYQWDPYVANDYHDTTIYNRELQRSHGYDITGHLMSKMVYEENMSWDRFYELMNNNKDALDRTFSLGPPYIYYTDAFVINVFGKAMGHTNYWTQTDPLFNYYSGGGEFGYGYGARNISYSWHPNDQQPYGDFDWLGDLEPVSITFSDNEPEPGENVTITVNVQNNGDVNMKNNGVKLFVDGEQVGGEVFQDINKFNNKDYVWTYIFGEGEYNIKAIVDEGNIKIEQNDSNNNLTVQISTEIGPTAPVLYPINDKNVGEMSALTIIANAFDANNDPLNYSINSSLFNQNGNIFTWYVGPYSSGVYAFEVSVSDGQFIDTQSFRVTIANTCTRFIKPQGMWDCQMLQTRDTLEDPQNNLF